MIPTATILARGCFTEPHAKTAHGLIRHGRKYRIISVIDETLSGRDAGEVIGIGNKGIPIVKDVDLLADVLIIGVAPFGGALPQGWRMDVIKAIENGMDVVSGMDDFLTDDPELVALAEERNVKLIDVGKSENKMLISQHIKPIVPVVLVCGTDAASGSRTTAIELYNTALARGITAGFIATSQAGIMIGCDAGVVVDNIPTDFVAGALEQMVQEVIKQSRELIFVEGQGALLHHAYSTSAIGILHGTQPQLIVLVHPAYRYHRSSFPDIPLPEPEEEISALAKLSPGSKVIALALNSHGAENYEKICQEYSIRTGLIATDIILDPSGADKILDEIIAEIDAEK
ncbi:DUF1611 domain-containing protein [[Eubacterium] cellulosolvens]